MLSKRARLFNVVRGAVALLVAFVVIFILICLTTDKPFEALNYMLIQPFNGWKRFSNVLQRMIPITFTGLAICVMFSADQFNLAGEGCVYLGGFVGGLCAVYLKGLPTGVHQVVCILVAMIAGGLVMLIPAVLKAKLGASEMVVSLMMNYVILDVCLHFFHTYFKDRTQGTTMTLPFESTAIIPKMFGSSSVSWGLAIAVAMSFVTWVFMYRTRWGYAIRTVGINKDFAQYSGIKVASTVILCQVVGGMLAGMGGAVETLGNYQAFRWTGLMGYGWNGVALAILASNNPIYVPIAGFFIAYLKYGCTLMNTNTTVPAEMMDIISVVIFLFFAADQFLKGFRQKMVVKETQEELAAKEVAGK